MPVLFPNIHHCRQTWPQKSYGLTAKTSTAVMPAGTVQIGRTNLDISGNDSALHNEMSKVLQAPTLHFFGLWLNSTARPSLEVIIVNLPFLWPRIL